MTTLLTTALILGLFNGTTATSGDGAGTKFRVSGMTTATELNGLIVTFTGQTQESGRRIVEYTDAEGTTTQRALLPERLEAVDESPRDGDESPRTRARLESPRAEAADVDMLVAAEPQAEADDEPADITATIHMSNEGGAVTVKIPERDMLPRTEDEAPKHVPVDICCVVDISGSMGAGATLGEQETSEDTGLTVMDITKHAVRTVAALLGADDKLAVVTFNGSATTVFAKRNMDEAGQAAATTKIDQIHCGGGTNLYAGVQQGLEALGTADEPGRQRHVLVLTDGSPNQRPPEGELEALKKLRERGYTATVSTFGFGYNLDTALLRELAEETGGAYSFIPNAGFTGCVFTHAMTNIQCTVSPKTRVTVNVVGGTFQDGTRAISLNMGPVTYGQQRSIAIPKVIPEADGAACTLKAKVELEHTIEGAMTIRDEQVFTSAQVDSTPSSALRCVLARSALVTGLKGIEGVMERKNFVDAERIRKELAADIQHHLDADLDDSTNARAYIEALLEDANGQVWEALDGKNRGQFDKWGKHYLPSLHGAHELEMCNNFKDPGVQYYGNRLFEALRDIADNTFTSKVTGPVPSGNRPSSNYGSSYSYGGAYGGSQTRAASPPRAPAAPVSMNQYYDRYAG